MSLLIGGDPFNERDAESVEMVCDARRGSRTTRPKS